MKFFFKKMSGSLLNRKISGLISFLNGLFRFYLFVFITLSNFKILV
jgi:hypothetical protein